MAKTFRNENDSDKYYSHRVDSNGEDAPWQDNRGPRHGNNRKMYARVKVTERRRERSSLRRDLRQDFSSAEF